MSRRDPIGRIEVALAALGADQAPPVGREQRVLDAAEERRATALRAALAVLRDVVVAILIAVAIALAIAFAALYLVGAL